MPNLACNLGQNSRQKQPPSPLPSHSKHCELRSAILGFLLQVCDFNLSKLLGNCETSVPNSKAVHSPAWSPPELFENGECGRCACSQNATHAPRGLANKEPKDAPMASKYPTQDQPVKPGMFFWLSRWWLHPDCL